VLIQRLLSGGASSFVSVYALVCLPVLPLVGGMVSRFGRSPEPPGGAQEAGRPG